MQTTVGRVRTRMAIVAAAAGSREYRRAERNANRYVVDRRRRPIVGHFDELVDTTAQWTIEGRGRGEGRTP